MVSPSLKISGILILLILFSFQDPVLARADRTNFVELIKPEKDSLIVARKPIIKCAITVPFSPEDVLILLDGVDVTGITNITPDGFEFSPIEVVRPGSHTLIVSVSTIDGREVREEFAFTTRHSEGFEEAYSNNEITAIYESSLKKTEDAANVPEYKIESNLSSESKLKERGWEFTLGTNLRYFDQDLSVFFPEKKGLNLIDYLLQGKYGGDEFQFLTEVGDVQINETQNTVQGLARRGGRVSLNYRKLDLNTFVVKSEQVLGFEGGIGIDGNTDDHIMGVSGAVGLFSERVRLKTIYVAGGEEEDSYGIYTQGGKRKGDVLGFVINADLFKEKLSAEAEFDLSEFDADTSDEFSPERDKAHKLKIGGYSGNYYYDATYEYMGREYEVIGNQGLQKDREGFTLMAGANTQIHSTTLSLSRYNDNVEKDDLYPRMYTYQGTIDYTFNKFQGLPIGLNYQKAMLESAMEPEYSFPMKMDTDTISGRINYMKGPWNFGLQTNYAVQDDRTPEGNDTTTATYTFMPTYFSEHISISPSISLNQSTYQLTDVRTDTWTATFDLRGNTFSKRITYELAGTFNRTESSDGAMEQDILNTNFRLTYLLGEKIWGFLNPSVGIRGLYNKTNDKVYDQESEEFALLVVLSTSMPFSF
jgi:hypothetical protein